MKLRCVKNKVRVRIRKSEAKILQQKGELLESVSFPFNLRLIYGIKLTDSESNAIFDSNKILLFINKMKVMNWLRTTEVALTFSIYLKDDEHLDILVEKDFPCKHTGDDFDDTYYELQPEEYKMFRSTQKTKKGL